MSSTCLLFLSLLRRAAYLHLDSYVPVGHIWKFDLEGYKLRNFGMKFKFSKNRNEPVMHNFLAKTENLRNTRSERPDNNRGKVVNLSSGKLLFPISDI